MASSDRWVSSVRRGLATASVFLVMAVGSAHVPVPDLAATTQVLAQEDGAYQPPEVEAETPAWIKPLAPLADLPLWAQAALASATLAVVVLVVLGGGRLAWRLITEQSFKSEADE